MYIFSNISNFSLLKIISKNRYYCDFLVFLFFFVSCLGCALQKYFVKSPKVFKTIFSSHPPGNFSSTKTCRGRSPAVFIFEVPDAERGWADYRRITKNYKIKKNSKKKCTTKFQTTTVSRVLSIVKETVLTLFKTDSLNTKPSINLKNLTNYYLNVKKHLLSASLPSERHRQFL